MEEDMAASGLPAEEGASFEVNEEYDEEDSLGDDVTALLRSTVQELEVALADSRQLLEAKEEEIAILRRDHDQLRTHVSKEILKKTELSSAFEESRRHATALEGLVERWQDELRLTKTSEEQLQAKVHELDRLLQAERNELKEYQAEMEATTAENEQLRSRIAELERTVRDTCVSPTTPTSPDVFIHGSTGGIKVPRGRSQSVDPELNWAFLKTSILHYFTDFHPYEQAKAIVSILDYDAQERKQIYAKLDEKFGKKYTAVFGRGETRIANNKN